MEHNMPSVCPVCSGRLHITKLTCPGCNTEVGGTFSPCKYCELDDKMKVFLEAFLKSRGNIKEVERVLSISYPTVKGLLDELLGKLFGEQEERAGKTVSSDEIFEWLENKTITVDEAAALLSGKEKP